MEWIMLTLSNGSIFSCPLNGWLDFGEEAAGPPNRTVTCQLGTTAANEEKKHMIRQIR